MRRIGAGLRPEGASIEVRQVAAFTGLQVRRKAHPRDVVADAFRGDRLGRCVLLALMACAALRASGITNVACSASGTLDQLIALNGNATPGCTIDGLNYSGFSWTETGGNTTVSASSVSFTTSTAPGGLGVLDFSSGAFTVSGSGALNYTLVYEIDPPPIIRMFEQDLSDPVTPPGFVNIPTTICLGAGFSGSVCPTSSTVSVDTFDDGGGVNKLHDSVTFAPQSTIGISTVIDLEGGTTGSASITGFGNTTVMTPEPASYLLTVLGLAALVWLRSKRARLLSMSFSRSD